MGPLSGHVALVAGGTKGIGEGIVRVLLHDGACVVASGHTPASCAKATAELTPVAGDRLSVLQMDIRSKEDCDRAVSHCLNRFGRLDAICINVGVYPLTRLEDMTESDIDSMFATNVKGVFFLTQAARTALMASGTGRVVITSSITGPITGYPGWTHYGASKAAVLGFIRSAALELAPYGITVNAVLPGNVQTERLRALGEDYLRRMVATIPIGFLGEPEDIGQAVAFLCSPGARYITGQSLVIDGGQTLPETPEALGDMWG